MTRKLRISILAALALLGVSLIGAPSASACSCARVGVGEFKALDEAIVGKLLRVERVGTPRFADYVFRVSRSFKRAGRVEAGDRVRVRSATSSASCGIEQPVGSTFGLLIYGKPGRWRSNLCLTMSPARIRRLAEKAGATEEAVGAVGGCSAAS